MITPAIIAAKHEWDIAATALRENMGSHELSVSVLAAKERWRRAVAEALTYSTDQSASRTQITGYMVQNNKTLQDAQAQLKELRAKGHDKDSSFQQLAQIIELIQWDIQRWVSEADALVGIR